MLFTRLLTAVLLLASGSLIVLPATRASAAVNVGGYVWANQPATASYTPAAAYAYNSSGQPITVTRSSVGRYSVRFSGLGTSGGVAHVAAYGGNNSGFCTVTSWRAIADDQVLNVRCFAATGVPADSRFTASFTRRDSTAAPFMSYLFSDVAAPPLPYTPSATYRFDTHGQPPTVERVSAGHYLVYDDTLDAAAPATNFSHVVATAYGTAPVHCRVADEGTEGAPPLAYLVLCTDAAGNPLDSRFTYTYVRGGNLLGDVPAQFGNAAGWANPMTPSNAALVWYSSGGPPVVEWLAVGRYRVRFPGFAGSTGYAEASPYGDSPRYCTVESWGPAGADVVVNIRCFDTTTGLAADVALVRASYTAP